jgi:hypothetical protein
MLQKLKVRMKCPTYHFEGPFQWAKHHQVVHVSTTNYLHIGKSRPIVTSPSKSYSTKKKKKGLIKQLYGASLAQSKEKGPPQRTATENKWTMLITILQIAYKEFKK